MLEGSTPPANMKDPDYIRLSRTTYQRLIEHLSLHSATDSWAESLLKELQQEVKPAYLCKSGSYLLDSEVEGEYEVN
jgi:hypothetical protein